MGYASLNKELFSALPSMLQDEQTMERSELSVDFTEPPKYSISSVQMCGENGDMSECDLYYSEMRVASANNITLEVEECPWWWWGTCAKAEIKVGDAGYLDVRAEMSCGAEDSEDCLQAYDAASGPDTS